MRILYIGNHNQRLSNDDEGAITFALQVLGHEVTRIPETSADVATQAVGDLVLFHKYSDFRTLAKFKGRGIPLVFWYFDLVDWSHDPTMFQRSDNRMTWMRNVIPLVSLGFCTDGDWVNVVGYQKFDLGIENRDKLIWLPQGIDDRQLHFAPPIRLRSPPSICRDEERWSGTTVVRRRDADQLQDDVPTCIVWRLRY